MRRLVPEMLRRTITKLHPGEGESDMTFLVGFICGAVAMLAVIVISLIVLGAGYDMARGMEEL